MKKIVFISLLVTAAINGYSQRNPRFSSNENIVSTRYAKDSLSAVQAVFKYAKGEPADSVRLENEGTRYLIFFAGVAVVVDEDALMNYLNWHFKAEAIRNATLAKEEPKTNVVPIRIPKTKD